MSLQILLPIDAIGDLKEAESDFKQGNKYEEQSGLLDHICGIVLAVSNSL
ncbi:hypothetical protein ACOSP7_010390 [Xanthoceras sorbifolium]